MELVTIIIAVYNAEKYVEECLKSISNQTYTNFECIVIDDGSKDESGKICDEFAKKDSRFIIKHIENQGVSVARNTGLSMAKGEYITIVDSDDAIDEDMLEVLVKTAKDNNADMAICNSKRVYIDVEPDRKERTFTGNVTVVDNIGCMDMMFRDDIFKWEVWGKLYKASLFGDNDAGRFPLDMVYEDLYLVPRIIMNSEVIVYVDKPMYTYTIRGGSIMSYGDSFRVKKDMTDVVKSNVEYFKKKNDKNAEKVCAYMYDFLYIMICCIVFNESVKYNDDYISSYVSYMKSMDNDIVSNRKLGKKKAIRLSYKHFGIFVFLRKVLKVLGKYKED